MDILLLYYEMSIKDKKLKYKAKNSTLYFNITVCCRAINGKYKDL